MDASREVTLLILGPSFQNNIFGSSTFEVKSRDEQHVVGMIRTDSDQLLVTFPLDLEVTVKAMLLGAALYLGDLIKEKRRNLQMQAQSNS
ncbi:phospholipid scramblase 3-like [Eleutherodactylus coqui]|uniref:phospholipid scramblase 3-like n=1 Tax=Eleutherodactylus coqui TaxID=57060 RepID=UPI0034619948